MSKIQDALKKIQSGGDAQSPADRSPEDTDKLATNVMQPATDRDSPEVFDGRCVEVDRSLLRAAGLIAPEEQERFIAEQYRIIKRPLLDIASGHAADTPKHANLIMITSALPGDGKTFNAINIALSIAMEKDTSVLLVDADVAKPHVTSLFGLKDEPGLIDALVDNTIRVSDLIIRSNVPGLSFLPAGRQDEHPTELLASSRMANIALQLSESVPNRVVIFDSPPVLVTSEARALASRMAQIVVVVCAGKTPQDAVQSTVESLDTDKALNLILNQAGTSVGDAAYGYYGYGYGHAV
jgi:protein-tyrosine kinase